METWHKDEINEEDVKKVWDSPRTGHMGLRIRHPNMSHALAGSLPLLSLLSQSISAHALPPKLTCSFSTSSKFYVLCSMFQLPTHHLPLSSIASQKLLIPI